VGELTAGGTRVNAPQRLKNVGAFGHVSAWTANSKAVIFDSLRNGTLHVFKQEINSDLAEQLTTGANSAVFPRVSPDGNWIVYVLLPKVPSDPLRMMRIPSSGGVPQLVMETPQGLNHACARAPATRCVVLEETQDGKQLMVSTYDPVKGRGKTLRTIEKNPSAHYFGSDLSSDGETFAISQSDEDEIRIRLLSLASGPDRETVVKGWRNLVWMGLHWDADQKGFYCGSASPETGSLLFVDLKGNARVLWQSRANAGWGHPSTIWGIPSPDGRYLALQGVALDSNIWMLEGF
jgi:Tol biopolymer transport system component